MHTFIHDKGRPSKEKSTSNTKYNAKAIQRWSAMSRVTLNFDLSKIPFVNF